MNIEARLARFGFELRALPSRWGAYALATEWGGLVFVSGHASRGDGARIVGKLGLDLDVAAGRLAARSAALARLASLKAQITASRSQST